jgi:hypothetical protein
VLCIPPPGNRLGWSTICLHVANIAPPSRVIWSLLTSVLLDLIDGRGYLTGDRAPGRKFDCYCSCSSGTRRPGRARNKGKKRRSSTTVGRTRGRRESPPAHVRPFLPPQQPPAGPPATAARGAPAAASPPRPHRTTPSASPPPPRPSL